MEVRFLLLIHNYNTLAMKNFALSLFFIQLICFAVFSQNQGTINPTQTFGFIQNKGQIHDQSYRTVSDVRYLYPTGKGLNVQLRNTGFSYDFYKLTIPPSNSKRKVKGTKQIEIPKHKLQLQRIDIDFVGCNPSPAIEASDMLTTYLQFQQHGEVYQFQKVTYKNVYPLIDVVFYANTKTQRVKYDFVVHPGGDVQQIKLRFKGFENGKLINNQLQLKHALGTLTEVIPQSWVPESGLNVDVKYKNITAKTGEMMMGFAVEVPLNKAQSLVIDPEPLMFWGTYLGDSLVTIGTGVATDKNGYVYACGTTQSVHSLATSGAFQSQINDSLSDAYLMKFDSYGQCLWATYFGGNDVDIAVDVQADTMGHVYLYGTTYSATNIVFADTLVDTIPTADSLQDSLVYTLIYNDSLEGLSDAFVAKFKKDGHYMWSAYYGGPGEEEASKLTLGFKGRIFISGTTTNSPTELATSGTHQTSNQGGKDVFVAKMDTSGVVDWGTYLGGTLDDVSTGLSFGDTNLFVCGYTYSTDFIATDSTHQDSLKGFVDGFISKFNPDNGQRIWSTYFGGTQDDYMNSVKAYNDYVYFVGTTLSDDFICSDSLQNQVHRNGLEDAFIGRIASHNGKIMWSTYVGGAMEDYGIELDIEMDNQAFLYGTTLSDSSIATADVQQSGRAGGKDVFISKFNDVGFKQWGSYFGGAMDEEAYAVDVFGNTAIYMTGSTLSDTGIVLNNQYFTYQDSLKGLTDGFLVKFKQNVSTMPGGFGGGTATDNVLYVCQGDTAHIVLIGAEIGSDAVWAWYKNGCGDPAPAMGFGDTLTFFPTSNFTLYVRAESVTNSTECAYIEVVVAPKPVAVITSENHGCQGAAYTFTSNADSTTTTAWSGPDSFSSTQQQPVLTPTDSTYSGTYLLKETNQYGCSDTATMVFTVDVPALVDTTLTTPSCYGVNDGSVVFNISGSGPFTTTFNGVTSSQTSFLNLVSGTYVYSVSDSLGCVTGDTAVLSGPIKIIADTLFTSNVCVVNSGVAHVFVDSMYTDYTAQWMPTNIMGDSVTNLPQGPQTVFVTLPNGCTDSVTFVIPPQHTIIAAISDYADERCAGANDGTATVTVTNGTAPLTYTWNPAETSQATVTNLSPGDYSVTVLDNDNCSTIAAVTIAPGDTLVWVDSLTMSDCGLDNGKIDITITEGHAPYTFMWSNGSSLEDLTAVGQGSYQLQIQDSSGCGYAGTFNIQYLNNLNVNASPDSVSIFVGDGTQLSSSSSVSSSQVSISWTPSSYLSCTTCANPIASPLVPTEYVVTYTHTSGCYGSDSIKIIIKDPCGTIFVPTAFSPNGDGLNDKCCVMGGCVAKIHMVVFDQWGEVIFETFAPDICWDGTYNGEMVQNDSYVYHVDLTTLFGNTVSQNGTVEVNH